MTFIMLTVNILAANSKFFWQISMDDYENNMEWDFKFINAVKEIKTHKCCGNDTFSSIDYNFLLTRYQGRKHITIVIPAIGEQLLARAKPNRINLREY